MWQLGPDADRPEWEVVETPFNHTLFGVVQTSEGPYAVASGGVLVANRGDGWEVVFDDGPATRQNQLRAIDVTDDGRRVWMVGSSGAMACYDVEERKKYDYSYPKEMTSTWEAVAVAGKRGSEKVLAANGSGEVLPFVVDGFDVDWGQLDKPAKKGSKLSALAASPDGYGYAIDTSGNAFMTTKDDGWKDIGIVNAQVKFYDIFAGKNQRVYVAAGDGRVYRYDDSYHNWTPIGVADNGAALRAFDVYTTDDAKLQMVALGNDGTIRQRSGEERWQKIHSPTSADLYDVTLGKPDVAIGKNGVVLQRPRGQSRFEGTSKDGDNYENQQEGDSDGGTTGETRDGGAGDEGGSSDGSGS